MRITFTVLTHHQHSVFAQCQKECPIRVIPALPVTFNVVCRIGDVLLIKTFVVHGFGGNILDFY